MQDEDLDSSHGSDIQEENPKAKRKGASIHSDNEDIPGPLPPTKKKRLEPLYYQKKK